jgi:hypothetical protein
MRIGDLLSFLRAQGSAEYLSQTSRNGKPPKYDRGWLLNVRYLIFNRALYSYA